MWRSANDSARTARPLLVLVAVAGLVLGSCSGDDDDGGDAAPTTEPPTTSPTTEPEDEPER